MKPFTIWINNTPQAENFIVGDTYCGIMAGPHGENEWVYQCLRPFVDGKIRLFTFNKGYSF